MSDNIKAYLLEIESKLKTGQASEHTYRGALQLLIDSIGDGIKAINEPKRISCGAPDYIITRGDIPVGFIEAKDIGKDLSSKEYKEQFGRYKKSLDNLIITDYLDFELYRDGEFVTSIEIAKAKDNRIIPIPENFETFTSLITEFCRYKGQTIKSASKLSKMMADKAKMLALVIEKALNDDENNEDDSTLYEQFEAFQQILIHDITPEGFADIYAQTIAYGMFAARLHDDTPEDFSRKEAAELIPKTNPFLRKLFQYISGYDIDTRIEWVVDTLADVFRATDLKALLQNFGRATQTKDPFIHFYETFLAEYDPKLRKSRGVWYTPEPVVNFIVRAVDDVLKNEFNLPKGLADSSKTKITRKIQGTAITKGKKKGEDIYEEVEVHKVQILDPATGTGTFLAEVIKQVHEKFKGQEGIWSNYVEEHLIPRLNGFELLMASYSMAHLKLEMLLDETGYKAQKEQRFNIYLTNSLEEHHADTGSLFSSWLSREANEANHIKRDTPVMVVMGNPPYSVSSSNNGEWIQKLMEDYKNGLNERNINPLSDDYIKFIRYGQHFIEKNGEGILAYISNNSFLSGLIHRKMRYELLKTFNKLYILDLHGNSKKQEKTPTGGRDENVFDIMQGVSINLFIKTKGNDELGQVYRTDIWGRRQDKYDLLLESSINSIKWHRLNCIEPNYYFFNINNLLFEQYNKHISLSDLFELNATGMKTEKDIVTVKFSKNEILETKFDFMHLSEEHLRIKYKINKEGRDWKLRNAIEDINNFDPISTLVEYRPFDFRYTFYTGKTKGFMAYPRRKIMDHIYKRDNISLVATRINRGISSGYIFITDCLLDLHLLDSAGDSLQTFPLYLYPDSNDMLSTETSRKPNLDMAIVHEIASGLEMTFTDEKEDTENTFAPIDILDYIYVILHSPSYREKYKEFLKIDFPRVPYPDDKKTFWKLVKLGGEIRQLHLLESPILEDYITQYPKSGDNVITRKINKNDWEITDPEKQLGRIWINDEQYFANIPLIAWEFYIGGYQPAQKWLKDRRKRELSFDDILHYQKIIIALSETDRIMKKIDTLIHE